MTKVEMIRVDYPEPHLARTRAILKEYPEMKHLSGNTPSTALYIFGLVAFQIGMTFAFSHSPGWAVLLGAYCIGAYANHALWVMIHECTHNLVFKGTPSNSLLQIFANLPIIFPSAISFRIFHIKHHIYQGDIDRDADLPRPFEVQWVGRSSFKKALWYLCYFISQMVRIPYMKGIPLVTPWVVLNYVAEISFLTAVVMTAGWSGFAYLALSSIFSIGLHPVGARWIQEHYVLHEKQETYSYYGPLNKLAFNVGYHNEHHDFMNVPWSRLPQIRAIAAEYYDSLFYHTSWTLLLVRFIKDPNLGLFSRVTRVHKVSEKRAAAPATQPLPTAAPQQHPRAQEAMR